MTGKNRIMIYGPKDDLDSLGPRPITRNFAWPRAGTMLRSREMT
jgi:hypothetical protein